MRLNPVKEFENLTSNLQRYFEDFPTFGLNVGENILPRMDIMEDEKRIQHLNLQRLKFFKPFIKMRTTRTYTLE